jgi:hypothetical protein
MGACVQPDFSEQADTVGGRRFVRRSYRADSCQRCRGALHLPTSLSILFWSRLMDIMRTGPFWTQRFTKICSPRCSFKCREREKISSTAGQCKCDEVTRANGRLAPLRINECDGDEPGSPIIHLTGLDAEFSFDESSSSCRN